MRALLHACMHACHAPPMPHTRLLLLLLAGPELIAAQVPLQPALPVAARLLPRAPRVTAARRRGGPGRHVCRGAPGVALGRRRAVRRIALWGRVGRRGDGHREQEPCAHAGRMPLCRLLAIYRMILVMITTRIGRMGTPRILRCHLSLFFAFPDESGTAVHSAIF